jgi:putative NADH-flavin reductase
MRMIVYGATGRIGSAIVGEALSRDHDVTAVVRKASTALDPRVDVRTGDIFDPEEVAELNVAHDVVVSAIGWTAGQPTDLLARVAQVMVAALEGTGKPLLVVGGAGTLRTESGQLFLDTPEFPEDRKANAATHLTALDAYRKAPGTRWIYLCPPARITDGQRTGRYRLGAGQLLKDEEGRSMISLHDFAASALDLVQHPARPDGHLSVAY